MLQVNDRITEINGKKIKNWEDLANAIYKINEKGYNGENISLKIMRDNKEINTDIKLTYSEELKINALGIVAAQAKISFFQKISASFYTFGNYFKVMADGLKMLITGKVSVKEVTGPVGLPKYVGQAYKDGGGIGLLNIFILLSINIGLMNLLPIPALDGGRLLFVIPEFFGIKVNKKIEERIHMIGMLLLLGLMVFIVFNDVMKYF